MYTKCLEEHLLVSTLKVLLIIFKLFASISSTFTSVDTLYFFIISNSDYILKTRDPNLSGTGDQFHRSQFFHGPRRGGMVWGWFKCITREGNGTPLQYSCLGNPMDGGAWWAAVHGVVKSQTWLTTSLSLFTFMHWRRKWQPTAVFLPGESQGRGSLVGCCLWGHTESDTTEAT